jgi:ElaB/YqjD/DUF883 family membrane-anchored ribosome-binding protein
MSKQKWSFKTCTSSIADTGDYESSIQFTNGKDTLETYGDELEDGQLQEFCELLDSMPDLWSHRCDNAEFELSQSKKKIEYFEKVLKTIRDAFWSEGETDKEKIDDLKSIAFKALHEVEEGLF